MGTQRAHEPGDHPDSVMAGFSEPVREWFGSNFTAPTAAQSRAWPPILAGANTLLSAPTGSGKTLAAFLSAIDRLGREPEAGHTRVVYVSPLRALAVDVDKNLRAPITGIAHAAAWSGVAFREPTVAVRTGDTSAGDRRRMLRHPPDILITTPESLYLMCTSSARDTLRGVELVIIDEIHALVPTKRGAHLALTLERLHHLNERPPQRIGLSATQRPLEVVSRFLGGFETAKRAGDDGGVGGVGALSPRPVVIVDAGSGKELDLAVQVPVEDMANPAEGSVWPSIEPELLGLVESHHSTLVFVNSRRLAERLASRLNELHGGTEELVKAHHGSLSRERRLLIEDELKRGELRGLVATSSLELGIDMGAVDLVVQVSSPGSVASGLQRIGRAGHQVGAASRGRIFPRHRADLLEAAVVVRRMLDGEIEHISYPLNPLDVLAQQVVACCALDDWPVTELRTLVRGAANFSELSDEQFANTADMLAGRYPSEEFAELRPRLNWDRVHDVLRGRKGSQRLAVTSGGTIPDRGLFGVFLPDGTRVGELDEEMVYESRIGEVFVLGASSWRIEDITFERVVVIPAPGQVGKTPFWHGDGPGRPLELGRAMGAFVRRLGSMPDAEAVRVLVDEHCLDERAARNLLGFLSEQADATGVVPDDRTIVVERFADELGDWRVCILTPFGSRVHAPWGMALRSTLSRRYGTETEVLWSDDGIILRLPEGVDALALDDLVPDASEVTGEVLDTLPGTALFASRFRESSARALLLPRRRPDRRAPLWQQRQRSADLLRVASAHPQFPMLLEATRECVRDVFDLPALVEVLSGVASRRIRVVTVDTAVASPFARSLLFGWIAAFMYEGDAPLAERRAMALSLDRELLRDLLGTDELASLLSPEVLAQVELERQRLVTGRRARDADELVDLLALLGPLHLRDLELRCEGVDWVAAALDDLVAQRRLFRAGVAGEQRWAAAADAGRLRDALGVALPAGLPAVCTEPVPHPLADLLVRYARTHGPFDLSGLLAWTGLPPAALVSALTPLVGDRTLVEGRFHPDGPGTQWVHHEVLRELRRRSLAALRDEVAPVETPALVRFLARWQHLGSGRRGPDGVVDAVEVIGGAALWASVLERDVLASRVTDYRPSDLDAVLASGEVIWVGAGSGAGADGRVRLMFRDQAASLTPAAVDGTTLTSGHHEAIRAHLRDHGASFWPGLVEAVAAAGLPYGPRSREAVVDGSSGRGGGDVVLEALWDLVWAGEITNDTFAPLRAVVGGSGGSSSRRSGGTGRRSSRAVAGVRSAGPPAAAGRWSLVSDVLGSTPSHTEVLVERASQLLARYGVLTREMALAEGQSGGFAGLYPVLKELEERGRVRRGYFVAGLGAAQFAHPAAVDRLRNLDRSGDDETSVLAASDPAQPFGAVLGWPTCEGRPSRSAGSFVIIREGEAVAYLERGGRSLLTFPAGRARGGWGTALVSLVDSGRVRSLELATVDGVPAVGSTLADELKAVGFVEGYRGLVRRRR